MTSSEPSRIHQRRRDQQQEGGQGEGEHLHEVSGHGSSPFRRKPHHLHGRPAAIFRYSACLLFKRSGWSETLAGLPTQGNGKRCARRRSEENGGIDWRKCLRRETEVSKKADGRRLRRPGVNAWATLETKTRLKPAQLSAGGMEPPPGGFLVEA